MTVSWTLELHCNHCQADIVYNTEIPDIKHDRNNIITNNRAAKFIAEHPNYQEGLALPENVVMGWSSVRQPKVYMMKELPTRYTICPVCGARVYFDEG